MPKGGGNAGGKYTIGSSKDASVRGQQKGAAASFDPKAPSMKGKTSPNAGSSGSSGKGYSVPPQHGGGKADKVSGTSGKNQQPGEAFGKGKKLGNHYSNS